MNKLEREAAQEQALKTALQHAIEDAVIGERLDRALHGRVKTVARAILLRHGLGRAQVRTALVQGGLSVEIVLPTAGPRVGVIRFAFAGDTVVEPV
jgi:hypothetical protein